MKREKRKEGGREKEKKIRPELHGGRKIKVSPPREGAGGGEGLGCLMGGRDEVGKEEGGGQDGNYWVVEDKDI